MQRAAELLKWAPPLPESELKKLDNLRFQALKLARDKARDPLKQRSISPFGTDLGPYLSFKAQGEIGGQVISNCRVIYEAIARTYLDDSLVPKIDGAQEFLEQLGAAILEDGFLTLCEVIAAAWLQTGPSVDDITTDPEFLYSRFASDLINHLEPLRIQYEGEMLDTMIRLSHPGSKPSEDVNASLHLTVQNSTQPNEFPTLAQQQGGAAIPHSHQERVERLNQRYAKHGADGKPAYVVFYGRLMNNKRGISPQEFAAWKSNRLKQCGKESKRVLDAAADKLF